MPTSKQKSSASSSPEKDPLNLLETTPNKHPRLKKHSFNGEIISTSLSPINLNLSTSKKVQQHATTNFNKKIKNSSLLSLSTTGNNSHTSYQYQQQQKKFALSTTKIQDDEDDTLDGEDILDTSPIKFMLNNDENNNSPRTITVPLAKEDDGLSPKNLIRNGTPAAKLRQKRKSFDFNRKMQPLVPAKYNNDDSEFESEEEEKERDDLDEKVKVPKRDIIDTPLDSYKFPNLVTSTVSKSVKRDSNGNKTNREDNDYKSIEIGRSDRKRDLNKVEREEDEPKKKKQVTTPRALDDTIDISDTISKASIYLDMKKKELQNRQEEKIISKDTTGKILNFEEEVQQEEEEESDDLINEMYHQKQNQNQNPIQNEKQQQQQVEHENYHLLQNWKSSKWNKLIKFLKIYQITKNDEMLSSKSIRQRFECDLDEIKLRIMILNKLNDRKKRR